MTDRGARRVLAGVCGVLVVAALAIDFPARAGGHFWSDGATYYSMTWSLARDLDTRYEPADVERVRREFPLGPRGVFLKRASGGLYWAPERGFPWVHRVPEDAPRLYFAKSIVYPVLAAPFVALFGTSGLLLTNAVAMGLALFLGYALARRRHGPLGALAWTAVLLLGSATAVYLVWPHPEIVNVGLITAGLWAWVTGRPLLSALLLGIATYSKPSNLLLALPLGVEPLLPGVLPSFGRGLVESLRRGAVLAATVAVGFGVNALVTGEVNYQGGDRKTFSDAFPGVTPGADFENAGFWMSTNQVGPLVEGGAAEELQEGELPPLAVSEVRQAFAANLGYFWIGRYAGAVAYHAPVVIATLLFLLVGPRDRRGGLALAALLVSWVVYVGFIPDNWYGGGGAVGNRYFPNLVPLGLLLLPRGRGRLAVPLAAAMAAVYVAPILARPFVHSQNPGLHARAAPFRVFPLELTMLNDLGFCHEGWRCKQPVGDTEGDPGGGRRADPAAYYLYFPDDGSVAGLEHREGRAGFRLRPGRRAEVVVRALEPVEGIRLRVRGGPGGDIVEARGRGFSGTLPVGPGRLAETAFETTGPGFVYHDTFLHVLVLRSRTERGDDASASFVSLELRTRPR